MDEWGFSDAKSAELLLRRRTRLGQGRKRAEKKRALQDPLARLATVLPAQAQQLSQRWQPPEAAALPTEAAPRRAAASLTRRTRAPQFCGRMWALEGGAGGGGGVDAEMGGGFTLMEEDLEVSSVRSDGATSCQTRPTSNNVLHFSSAAPNGKLARGGRQPAVLHRQRIGWD